MTSHIKPGQVYRSCDPRGGPTIRIVRYEPGWNRAQVVDAATGKQPRRILAKDLHPTDTTRGGTARRTGYALKEI